MALLHRLTLRWMVAMAVALAAAAIGLSFAAHDASAYCRGGPAVWGESWGEEFIVSGSGTCDDDGFYRGLIRDILTDGSCIWVQYRDGAYFGTQGQACTTSFVEITFQDQTGDQRAQFRLCRRQGCGEWVAAEGY
jgi:hypothetical protein